jgi:NADH:ubiquinone reductase (H+-translocating)
VHLNALLEDSTEAAARLSSGEEIPTRTVVWTAGVRPQAPTLDRDIAQSRSRRLVVDDRLRIPGTRGVFAIGDVASIRYGDNELPMLSAPAIQAGRYVAREIIHEVKESGKGDGRSARFRYVDKGVMATIGRHAAVGRLGRLSFTGFLGWLMWLVVHLYYLVSFRNRLAVFALWGWNYFRKDRPIRIIASGLSGSACRARGSTHSRTPREATGRTQGRDVAPTVVVPREAIRYGSRRWLTFLVPCTISEPARVQSFGYRCCI